MSVPWFPPTPTKHKGWLPEPLPVYLRENSTSSTNKQKKTLQKLTGGDWKCGFDVCITPSQIIQCNNDRSQEKKVALH